MNIVSKMEESYGKMFKSADHLVIKLINIIEVILVIYSVFRCFVERKISVPVMIVSVVLFTASYLGLRFAYKIHPDSEKVRYYACMGFATMYTVLLIFYNMDYGFVFGYVIGLFFILYFDMKIIILSQIVFGVLNFVQLIVCIIRKQMPSGRELDLGGLTVQIIGTILFATVICIITAVSNSINRSKTAEIEINNEKIESLLSKTLEIANIIREDADKGNSYMEALDSATDSALQIFKDIASGNAANAKSVEEQAVMTMKITDLIAQVEHDTSSAVDMTEVSVKGMAQSKDILNQLKAKSTKLMEQNKHILNTINDFVTNTNKVNDNKFV